MSIYTKEIDEIVRLLKDDIDSFMEETKTEIENQGMHGFSNSVPIDVKRKYNELHPNEDISDATADQIMNLIKHYYVSIFLHRYRVRCRRQNKAKIYRDELTSKIKALLD